MKQTGHEFLFKLFSVAAEQICFSSPFLVRTSVLFARVASILCLHTHSHHHYRSKSKAFFVWLVLAFHFGIFGFYFPIIFVVHSARTDLSRAWAYGRVAKMQKFAFTKSTTIIMNCEERSNQRTTLYQHDFSVTRALKLRFVAALRQSKRGLFYGNGHEIRWLNWNHKC